MKKLLLVFLAIIIASQINARDKNDAPKEGFVYCTEFHLTQPLRDLVKKFPVIESNIPKKNEESEDREHRIPQKFKFTSKDGAEWGNDPNTVQSRGGTVAGRAPIMNIAGQSATGFRPMDPSGAAGLTQYVQMINSTTFRVYDKTTGSVSLTATLGTLWSPATANSGDPIVLYDKAANRWMLAQFGSSTDRKIYIAISTTGDATGSYYTYTFVSPAFPDYLKFSVWQDGYYMTSNQGTQVVFAFERTAMLAGNAASRAVYTSYTPPNASGFFVPLAGDAGDGALPAAGTPCPIFSYSDNGWGASYSDAVNVYNMTVNWVPTTPTATITLAGNIPAAAFDAQYNSSWNDVIQPGTTQKLDGIGGCLMYRAQWTTWAGYNSVVLNWGVYINAAKRGIKWCELRQDQSTNAWSIYQEGIYAPDTATRWMGSIAMDKDGSIGLAYMYCSAANTLYPSIAYTGRRSCDPLGTLPITETIAIAGTGFQTGTNRNGDYSQLSLDPDGSTFWYTSEYFGGTSGSTVARTQIVSFQITPCGNNASVFISQTAGTNPTCPGNSVTFTAVPTNGGTTPVYQWKINGANAGTNSPTFTTSSLTNGQIVTCVMTSNMVGVTGSPATSNSITMTVNPVVTPSITIAQTSGSNPSCAGSSVQFTATPTNGGTTPSYQWKVNGANAGTNSSTFITSSLTNGQIVSCVLTSNATCTTTTTATSNTITMGITPVANPTVTIAQTSGGVPTCTGASVTFTATVSGASAISTYQWKVDGLNSGTNSSTFTTSALTNGQIVTCDVNATATCPTLTSYVIGTGTGTSSTTSGLGSAYPTYYGNGRQQYIIRAAELTAAGLTAGALNTIAFNVAGTTGDPATLNGYTIKMALTSTTATTTTFQTTATTTVFGPINYTPTLNAWNTHTLSSPFTWNGTSNLLIDICFSNSVVGITGYQNYVSSPGFNCTTYYQLDGATTTVCSRTTGTAGTSRPNITFSRGVAASTSTSNSLTITVNPSCGPTANLKVFIQGFYLGSSLMRPVLYNMGLSTDPTACDTITVDLHNPTTPYAVSESVKTILHTNGTAAAAFSAGSLNRPYYVVIRHRNSLETWSAAPVTIVNNVSYDFTTAANQTFGSNAAALGSGVFANYSGDIDQDGIINLTDLQDMENTSILFLSGYYSQDLTGDGQTESADYSLVENNLAKLVLHP